MGKAQEPVWRGWAGGTGQTERARAALAAITAQPVRGQRKMCGNVSINLKVTFGKMQLPFLIFVVCLCLTF